MSALPFDDLRDLFNTGKEAGNQRAQEVRVSFYVDPSADPALVAVIRRAFVPELPSGMIHVELIPESGDVNVHPSCDLVVVVCGNSTASTSRCVRRVLLSSIPCVSVCQSKASAPSIGAAAVVRGHYGIVSSSKLEDIPRKLAKWISHNSSKQIAFAANFAFVRDAVSDRFVDECAFENALLGAFRMLPGGGGDFAFMTLNEAKLAFDVSALYGEPLSINRASELIWIFGAGYLIRLFSRSFSRWAPLPTWLLDGFLAWAGTQIIGQTINARLRSDEGFIEMFERLLKQAGILPDSFGKGSPSQAAEEVPAQPLLTGAVA